MKRLNNKGITTIELLLCFILVMVMAMSMYGSISSFNKKAVVEQYKQKVYTYKEILTKDIQSDLIRIGVVAATKTDVVVDNSNRDTYANAPVGNVVQVLSCQLKDGSIRELKVYKDYALVEYGVPGSLTQYPLPEVKDLVINNVKIAVESDSVLSIYIGLYHPEVPTKYAIDILCPINYIGDKIGSPIFTKGIEEYPDYMSSTYVASFGNDTTGNGTLSNPFETIGKAYEQAGSNDTIYIMTDIVQKTTSTFNGNKNITIRSCSTAGNLVTIPHSIIRSSSFKGNMINITNGSVELTNIVFDGSGVSATNSMIKNAGVLNLNGSTILKNAKCSDNGGAIYNSGILNISNAVLEKNTSEKGGAICSVGTINIYSGSFFDNKANNNAGAIWSAGNLNIAGGTFSNNEASMAGAINCTYTNDQVCVMKMTGGSINNNKSKGDNADTSGNGGGLYINRSDTSNKIASAELTGGEIKNNESTMGGGGIHNRGNLTLGAITISNNKSTNGGGGVQNIQKLTVNGATINNNTGGYGGGINNTYDDYWKGEMLLQSGTITNNTANTYAGGVFNRDNCTLNMSGGTVTNNTSGEHGGGINNDGTFNLSGGTISSNKSTASKGGGVATGNSGTTTITGGTVVDNDPSKDTINHNFNFSNSGKLSDPKGSYTYNNSIHFLGLAKNTDLVADLTSGADHASIHIYTYSSTNANQKWKIIPTKAVDGIVYYSIQSQKSTTQVMSVSNSSGDAGANILAWEMSRSASGRFFSLKKIGNYYQIKNIKGKCMSLEGTDVSSGKNVYTANCNDNSDYQKWKLR